MLRRLFEEILIFVKVPSSPSVPLLEKKEENQMHMKEYEYMMPVYECFV
jgi:hypothetical protein